MGFRRIAAVLLLLPLMSGWGAGTAAAQDAPPVQLGPRAAPTAQVQVGTLPVMDTTPAFDAAKATDRYLAKVSGEARARSDAYFEGGYWLKLVDLLYALGVAALLLFTPISTRIRDWAEERTHSRTAQVMLYVAAYVPLVTVLALPLTLYEGFVREHSYGLSNQSFWQWLGDFGIGFALTFVAAVLLLPLKLLLTPPGVFNRSGTSVLVAFVCLAWCNEMPARQLCSMLMSSPMWTNTAPAPLPFFAVSVPG